MATESPNQRSDEATLTSSTEPTIKVDSDSQNVDSKQPHVNGEASAAATDELENKHISDIVDDLVNSTEVSISGGSDNEAARSDASKTKDDAKSQGRASSSVKKPTSFKAINVNKTFLTSKTPAPGTQPKAAEKAAPTTSAASPAPGTTTTSRPRLVAKVGSGLITKSSGGNGGKPAPDPSAVWNKNRPAPPPEPKKYTDEELRKYGIHMASRLQSDSSKGHSNWADIEDDDDDWAPDTITWKDGTKVAITHPEGPPANAPASESKNQPASKDNAPAESTKASSPSSSPSVKPGVLGSGKGLVLKGAPEKPTLVAKPPPPPAPTKSPWAPLPKIERVSPAAVEAQTGPRPQPNSGDARTNQIRSQPPPKEIAADDFSRTPWRDGPQGGNRELFNSQSGRYEPAPDRRGPMRQEPQYGRHPAVMQRPPHHEQQGPTEYSGGLQPGRNEHQGPEERRRGSSNIPGGSGSWQRLKGAEHPLPPPELINARRASTTAGSESPASPRNFSPSGAQGGSQHGHAFGPRPSPGTAHATPYSSGTGPAGRTMPPPVQPSPTITPVAPITEDDIELQKRLMRERRELALKRRQEEEAREEAARRERIRLKLEALGPPPETSKSKKAAAKDQASTPTQIQSREPTHSEKPAPERSQEAQKEAPQAVTPQPQPAKQPPTQPIQSTEPAAQTVSKPDGAESRPQPHPWATAPRQGDRPAAVWGPQPSTKNVWAAPNNNNNRSLGNGTFVTEIGAPPPPSGPGPIAPPSSVRAAGPSQTNMTSAAPWQPPIGPPRQPQAPRSTGEHDMKDNPWAAAVRANDDRFSEMLNSQQDDRERRLQAEGRSLAEAQPAIKDTWRPTRLDENGVRTEGAPKQTIHIGKENPWAGSAEPKPSASQQAPSVPGGDSSEYSQLPQSTIPAHDMASASMIGTKTAVPPGRGSRFFPARDARQDARDVRPEPTAEALRHNAPSPPPPDMAGHPAFDGDATHPHVSLPRPHPIVRLPPAASESKTSAPEANRTAAGSSRSQGPSFAWASQPAYKEADGPRASTHKPENPWQAKIDNLLGDRKVHPSRTAASDVQAPPQKQQESSVPEPVAPDAGVEGLATTKVMAEECFEEQEMGSVPPIRLPKTVPEMAWQPSPAPKPLSKKLWPTVLSAEPISFPVDVSGAGNVWRICIPGTESKTITVPFGRTRSNPRRGGPRGGRHNSSAQHRQGKGRDGSSSYPGEQRDGASGSNSHGRNHRGGYRGRENWSRHAASQIQA
ncbi:uncharacterized protein P884DRAFT_199591 [Thermothelomyces heterothallicus CBS 202.75]|uniref:uncharacterized protein n=1 Tax=Thermothelomyces heterothallicus CBS 202.75 TaxID=1149848 RepID=UPI0037425146